MGLQSITTKQFLALLSAALSLTLLSSGVVTWVAAKVKSHFYAFYSDNSGRIPTFSCHRELSAGDVHLFRAKDDSFSLSARQLQPHFQEQG